MFPSSVPPCPLGREHGPAQEQLPARRAQHEHRGGGGGGGRGPAGADGRGAAARARRAGAVRAPRGLRADLPQPELVAEVLAVSR